MTLVYLKYHELGMWIMIAGNVIAYELLMWGNRAMVLDTLLPAPEWLPDNIGR